MRIVEKLLVILILFLALGAGIRIADERGIDIVEKTEELKEELFSPIHTDGTASSDHQDLQLNDSFSDFADAYYGMLDDRQKSLYAEIYANAENGTADFSIDTDDVTKEDLEMAFRSVYYDHPGLFWLDSSYSYQYDTESGNIVSVSLQFNETADDLETSRQAFEDAADSILSQAEQYSGDYEKEKYVHDALIDMTEYDLNADLNQSAYSLLVNHRTVCAGYARTFQYLMNRLSIVCYYVTGTSEGQDHGWNMVLLDGEFYNVDVTWDDAASAYDRYYFFNLPDEEFNAYHERGDMSQNLPACTSSAYAHLEDGDIYQNIRFVPAE